MKRTRQIALICSSLLTLQSGVMGLLLLWFNRFSSAVFYQIPNIPFRIFVLYIGFLLGVACVYTAYFYQRPGFISSTFFMIVGLLGLVNGIVIDDIFFLIYTVVLSLGFIYVGIVGHYYRQIKANLYGEKRNDKRKNTTVQTK